MQRAAAGSQAFYADTARAVVQLVGLDRGMVLLRRGDDWETTASHSIKRGDTRQFSRRVLAEVTCLAAPEDGNFPRAVVARREGLHAAFGFPLLSARGVVGVMEFFSRELREPDQRLLETMNELGSQVGQFVVRRHAEEAVRKSESRLRAMLGTGARIEALDHWVWDADRFIERHLFG